MRSLENWEVLFSDVMQVKFCRHLVFTNSLFISTTKSDDNSRVNRCENSIVDQKYPQF